MSVEDDAAKAQGIVRALQDVRVAFIRILIEREALRTPLHPTRRWAIERGVEAANDLLPYYERRAAGYLDS